MDYRENIPCSAKELMEAQEQLKCSLIDHKYTQSVLAFLPSDNAACTGNSVIPILPEFPENEEAVSD